MVIKQLVRELRNHIRLLNFQEKWRNHNTHNATKAGNIFPIAKVQVGEHTYGTLNIYYYNQDNEQLNIGKYCSIANDVHIFIGGEHDYKTLSSYPFKNLVTKNKISEAITKGPVRIDDDVWIGYGVTILSGSHICKGAVIGAGSVVSGTVEPYSIYVGNKVVKYRFSNAIIKKLMEFDLGMLDWNKLDGNFEFLYNHIDETNIDSVLVQLEKNC